MDLQDLISGDPAKDRMITTMIASEDFIAEQVAPRLGMPKKHGKIGIADRGDKLTDESVRVDHEPAKLMEGIVYSRQTFDAKSIDRRAFISNEELKHGVYESNLIKMAYSERLTKRLMLLKEKQLIDKITTAANYRTTTNKVSVGINDKFTKADADPIVYLQKQADIYKKAYGVTLDSIVFGWYAWTAFLQNPLVAAKIAFKQYKTVTLADVLPLLKTGSLASLQNIIISGAVADTSKAKDTVSRDFLMQDDVVMFKKASAMQNVGLVDAGLVVSVESDDPDDFGSLEYRDESNKLKGIYLENRMALDIMNASANSTYLDGGFLLKGTGIPS